MFRAHSRHYVSLLVLGFLATSPVWAEESPSYSKLLTPLLKTSTDVIGQPIAYPSGNPTVTAAIVVIEPGKETGWHIHHVPLFATILEGEMTIDYGEKGIKVLKTGDSVMEAMNWPHNGMNKGAVPVRLLAVYLGSDSALNTEIIKNQE